MATITRRRPDGTVEVVEVEEGTQNIATAPAPIPSPVGAAQVPGAVQAGAAGAQAGIPGGVPPVPTPVTAGAPTLPGVPTTFTGAPGAPGAAPSAAAGVAGVPQLPAQLAGAPAAAPGTPRTARDLTPMERVLVHRGDISRDTGHRRIADRIRERSLVPESVRAGREFETGRVREQFGVPAQVAAAGAVGAAEAGARGAEATARERRAGAADVARIQAGATRAAASIRGEAIVDAAEVTATGVKEAARRTRTAAAVKEINTIVDPELKTTLGRYYTNTRGDAGEPRSEVNEAAIKRLHLELLELGKASPFTDVQLTAEESASLPSGTIYLGSDGRRRRV